MQVHLVIPAYRESLRLPPYLNQLCDALARTPHTVSLQVVDDGSGNEETARLRELIDSLRPRHPFLLPLLALEANRGKGGAIYSGWDAAPPAATMLGFVDADGSIPAGEVVRLLDLLQLHHGPPAAVFASRIRMLGRTLQRPFARYLLGRSFANLAAFLLHLPCHDTQCGCKFIPATAYPGIRHRLTEMGFAFDIDLLLRLLEDGIPVREEAIDWIDVPGGHIRWPQDPAHMILTLLRLSARRR